MKRYASVLALTLALSAPLAAKSEIVRMTIAAGGLPRPLEVTDRSILVNLNIWVGPGTTINGVPDARDGVAMWSKGPVSNPPQGLPRYEVSFYGRFPEERLMYVIVYQYDPKTKKGWIYLPGRGEHWYETNVRTIIRGVEGRWFHASEDFAKLMEPLLPLS